MFLLRLSAHTRRKPLRRRPHTGTPSDMSTCDCMPDRSQFPLPATTADSVYDFPYAAKTIGIFSSTKTLASDHNGEVSTETGNDRGSSPTVREGSRSSPRPRTPDNRGRERRLVSFPLPPNRTGGSPASGSPVGGSPLERTDARTRKTKRAFHALQ